MAYWHVKNPDLLQSLMELIEEKYPSLIVLIEDNFIHIRGPLRITDDQGLLLDTFSIDMKLPANFPEEIPEVWEISNKIPRINDRHVDKNGKACLCYRDAIYFYWKPSLTIVDFIKIFVEPFFLWQVEYEITGGKNQDKAYKHGPEGGIQFYQETSGFDDVKIVRQFVECLANKTIKHYWFCFCDSGKKLGDCHMDKIMEYHEIIRKEHVRKSLGEINKFLGVISI